MITPQAQIKINLPLPLKEFLESKANKFGMPIAGYVRHLILRDVEEMEYPEYEQSLRTIRAYKKAIKERDKAIEVKGDIREFLEKL